MKNYLKTILISSFLFAEKTFAQDPGQEPVSLINGIKNPLDTSGSDPNLGQLFNNIFFLVLALAIILAVFGIIRAGYTFMVSGDNASKREDAKNRVVASVGGLILALGAVLILNTINPDLTNIKISFPQIQKVDLPAIDIPLDKNKDGIISKEEYAEWLGEDEFFSSFSTESTENALRILEAAKYAADNTLDTCSAAGTEGGKLACAYAVNLIVQKAVGEPIENTLSTAKMDQTLKKSARFDYVGNDLSQALPGDIIMSATVGKNVGHVGISETVGATTIISNSSNHREVRRNYYAEKWNRDFKEGKGLEVSIYRPK